MIDWNLQVRGHRCHSCTHHFADGEAYHTLLFDERGAYARLDVCENCWVNQFSQGCVDRKGFISHWQGVFRAPVARPDPIQQATAESLLRELSAQGDPKFIPARYILAVMLERKRRLKVKSELREDGLRTFIYEQPETGDVFKVVDPELQLGQLEEVQREVARLLQEGLPKPPDSPAAHPTASGLADAGTEPSPDGVLPPAEEPGAGAVVSQP